MASFQSIRYIYIYIYGSVSKPCTPVVHIKIAGKWMFIPLKMVLNGINRYWSIAMSIGIIITGRGGINKIFDTMNQRDSSFVALCPVASLMFASQWLIKHILNHPASTKHDCRISNCFLHPSPSTGTKSAARQSIQGFRAIGFGFYTHDTTINHNYDIMVVQPRKEHGTQKNGSGRFRFPIGYCHFWGSSFCVEIGGW